MYMCIIYYNMYVMDHTNRYGCATCPRHHRQCETEGSQKRKGGRKDATERLCAYIIMRVGAVAMWCGCVLLISE
eukprot:COSAG06_NODE_9319_length_1923_cov_11.299454_3_plen_74_part_00